MATNALMALRAGLVLALCAAAGCEDREIVVGGWSLGPVDKPGGPATPPDGGPITADTPIAGCRDWKTIGEMDLFFASRCGEGAACHSRGSPFGDYASPGVFERVANKPSIIDCRGSKLADPENWRLGLLWLKSLDDPRCPDGRAAGEVMPSPAFRLNTNELACLEGFLKVISGGK